MDSKISVKVKKKENVLNRELITPNVTNQKSKSFSFTEDRQLLSPNLTNQNRRNFSFQENRRLLSPNITNKNETLDSKTSVKSKNKESIGNRGFLSPKLANQKSRSFSFTIHIGEHNKDGKNVEKNKLKLIKTAQVKQRKETPLERAEVILYYFII